MLKPWRLFLGLALIVAIDVDSHSQEPPGNKSEPGQQHSEPEQRTTNQSPAIVPTDQTKQTEEKAKADESDRAKKQAEGWTLSDKIAAGAIIAGMLQFFALVATVFVMIRTAKRQLRAYVFNDHATLVDFDDVPTIQVLIKNAGQTPAFSVVAWNAVRLSQVPLEIELGPPGEFTVTRCNLGPGMSFHLTTRLAALPQTKRAAIRAGTEALYVHGRADYIDAFGSKRVLTWRLLYGAESARRPDGSLEVHQNGNEAN